MLSEHLHNIEKAAMLGAAFLIVSYVFSLLARLNWMFDLFSHFTIQYAIGGLVLGLLVLAFQNYALGVLCLVVMIGSVIETRALMHDPWLFSKPAITPNFKIVQYNRLYTNKRFDKLETWLKSEGQDVDIMLVQESRPETIAELEKLKSIFPYQFPENADQRFGDVSVLSRHPFSVTAMPLKGKRFANSATRVEIQKDSFEKPVVIYSFHTKVPMGPSLQEQRNEELAELAKTIAADDAENIIACGDWNITPFSPYFTDFLKTSGLRYQNLDYLPATTWPSTFALPFLKIPIDQITYSAPVILTNIQRGPAMGSDHHSLVASFAF